MNRTHEVLFSSSGTQEVTDSCDITSGSGCQTASWMLSSQIIDERQFNSFEKTGSYPFCFQMDRDQDTDSASLAVIPPLPAIKVKTPPKTRYNVIGMIRDSPGFEHCRSGFPQGTPVSHELVEPGFSFDASATTLTNMPSSPECSYELMTYDALVPGYPNNYSVHREVFPAYEMEKETKQADYQFFSSDPF